MSDEIGFESMSGFYFHVWPSASQFNGPLN